AAAQEHPFGGGGVSRAQVWFGHTETQSPMISNDDTSGATTDWFISGGGVVAKHAVIQAELTFGSNLETTIPPSTYVPDYPYQPLPSTDIVRYTYRFRQVAVLGGYTTDTARRVHVSALAGVAFVQTRALYYALYMPYTPLPYSIPTEETRFGYFVAPIFGMDVAIRVAPHTFLVPQVRARKIPGGGPMSVSAGIGGRVQ
ncbi:MAG TPA: hypothetical protein VG871_08250, partial [Vicinamibacterales bacterium]|nr:hypothetical protein [Vicinamibacterales bacterium]